MSGVIEGSVEVMGSTKIIKSFTTNVKGEYEGKFEDKINDKFGQKLDGKEEKKGKVEKEGKEKKWQYEQGGRIVKKWEGKGKE